MSENRHRESKVTVPAEFPDDDLVGLTRTKVEPMVRGLFPQKEQDTVIGLLERSVVFLTPETIESCIQEAGLLSTSKQSEPSRRHPQDPGVDTFEQIVQGPPARPLASFASRSSGREKSPGRLRSWAQSFRDHGTFGWSWLARLFWCFLEARLLSHNRILRANDGGSY